MSLVSMVVSLAVGELATGFGEDGVSSVVEGLGEACEG